MNELLIVAVVAILYIRSMRCAVIVDDIRHYADIQRGLLEGKRPWLIWLQLKLYGGGTFSHRIQCECKGIKTTGEMCKRCNDKGTRILINCPQDHLFTTALFALTCVLIYEAFGRNYISLTAALLYACNPANNQTSIWLNGRRYSINIIISLLMLVTPFALPLYFFSLVLQANVLTAPVMLGGWYLLMIPMAVALGWKHGLRFYNRRIKHITNPDIHYYGPKRAVIVLKTFGYYVVRMLVPGLTLMVYRYLSGWGMTADGNKESYRMDKFFWIGVVSWLLVIAGLILLPQREKWILLYLFLSTLQFSNVVSPVQTIADRYISAPNVAMMYLVSYVGFALLGTYALPVFAFILGAYVQRLNITFMMYKDIVGFHNYHNFFDEANTHLRKLRANWLMKAGDPMGAWEVLKVGLMHNPRDFSMLYLAGVNMGLMGDARMSEYYLGEAEKCHYLGQAHLWGPHIKQLREQNQKALGKKRALQPSDWKNKK